jgi:putative FmdB family regulatory protein
MPTYDFACKCGHEDKLICSMKEYDSQKEKVICEKCGEKMERQYNSIKPVNIGKYEDPNSAFYWKKGKTLPQQADMISNPTKWH